MDQARQKLEITFNTILFCIQSHNSLRADIGHFLTIILIRMSTYTEVAIDGPSTCNILFYSDWCLVLINTSKDFSNIINFKPAFQNQKHKSIYMWTY